MYDSLLATLLHDISESTDHPKAMEAGGFLHHVAKLCFILSSITFNFDRILSCINSLSDQLQSDCHQKLRNSVQA